LSAIFVDYDNIYMALKRRSEEAAKRFSKDASLWLKELESGRLISPTSGFTATGQRRIVMNRCYGNPMPRRNSSDNSTDMNSFPFVRHHFLRAGSEVIDCPPLTAQLKNSADIRIVMDVRDMISHDTYFDEFIILSGDADFTPLLHRLRAHARRTVIYANDHTAQPYTAISDGEVRETDLLRLLLEGSLAEPQLTASGEGEPAALPKPATDMTALRRELIAEITALVKSAGQPVPLEALADRLVRQLGHEKTAGTGWGGTGGFRDLLASHLPEEYRMSGQPPFVVFEVARMMPAQPESPARPEPQRIDRTPPAQRAILPSVPPTHSAQPPQPAQAASKPSQIPAVAQALTQDRAALQTYATLAQQRPAAQLPMPPLAAIPQPAPAPAARGPQPTQAIAIQQAVARIYEACQAPPLSPPEYRAVFEVMAAEINARGLTGAPTLDNIINSAKGLGVEIRLDDVRFLLDVVSESDPWFEQGASSSLFASRFRNFVVARCRSHGLALTAEELDLIEHWFAAPAPQAAAGEAIPQRALTAGTPAQHAPLPAAHTTAPQQTNGTGWWSMNEQGGQEPLNTGPAGGDDFPRIIRSRLRS